MWACPQAIGYVQIEKDRLMYKIQIKANCASLNCWEKRFVCETGVKDIFKDPCDCGGSAWNKYMSGQGEERDCVFAEQNVDFSFFFCYFIISIYIFWFEAFESSQKPSSCTSSTVGGRVRFWLLKVWWWKRKVCCS